MNFCMLMVLMVETINELNNNKFIEWTEAFESKALMVKAMMVCIKVNFTHVGAPNEFSQ